MAYICNPNHRIGYSFWKTPFYNQDKLTKAKMSKSKAMTVSCQLTFKGFIDVNFMALKGQYCEMGIGSLEHMSVGDSGSEIFLPCID